MGRNNWKQEDADAYDRQAVQDCKEASVRSLQSGQVQCGLGWRGWTDDWTVRRRLAEQSLQALEQNELGKLLSTASARHLHSQKVWRPEDFRCTHRGRSRGPDGCQTAHCVGSGPNISGGLLRLSA